MKFNRLANSVLKRLNDEGVECYLWHSANTGSAYIRFNDNRIGSIRLGDHKGRPKLSYRWNIRSDFPKGHNKWHKVNDKWRFYTHTSNWIELIPHILERKTKTKGWVENKYTYFTPKYKR